MSSEAPTLPERSRQVQEQVTKAGLSSQVRVLPDSARTAKLAAAALGCTVGAIANSLVFMADGAPLLVMTSGDHRANTDVIAAAVQANEVRMATPDEVRAATGQAIGGVAPVGHPVPLTTLVDEHLRTYEQIWTAGGTPSSVMPMTFDELVNLTSGTVTTVA
ncbi:YbaK/EbsC family protein [Microbacterium sp. YY-01]|uniref:YbaK/EbsC family protein n=1 Tax=Microbacterium sp. YY-01 TaxID=3421634 RepID=UPI003D164154